MLRSVVCYVRNDVALRMLTLQPKLWIIQTRAEVTALLVLMISRACVRKCAWPFFIMRMRFWYINMPGAGVVPVFRRNVRSAAYV